MRRALLRGCLFLCLSSAAASITAVSTTAAAQDASRNPAGQGLAMINNYIEVTPALSVSGQPSAAQLETFKARGIEAVLYIAPHRVSTTVKDEPDILSRQGVLYANIPIEFGKPTAADFDAFSKTLAEWRGKRMHVHCQVNMRGTAMMFLYRVIHDKVPPDEAYAIVRRIWVPDKVWSAYINETLKRHGIAFDAF